MTLKSAREIDAVLADLPLEDRVIALAANMIMRHPQALKAVCALIGFVSAMAKFLSEPERITIAEIMRDSADAIEHRQLERV